MSKTTEAKLNIKFIGEIKTFAKDEDLLARLEEIKANYMSVGHRKILLAEILQRADDPIKCVAFLFDNLSKEQKAELANGDIPKLKSTMLCEAADSRKALCVGILLNNGADANKTNLEGETPVSFLLSRAELRMGNKTTASKNRLAGEFEPEIEETMTRAIALKLVGENKSFDDMTEEESKALMIEAKKSPNPTLLFNAKPPSMPSWTPDYYQHMVTKSNEILAELIKYGANVSDVLGLGEFVVDDNSGTKALHYAVERAKKPNSQSKFSTEEIFGLLDNGARLEDVRDWQSSILTSANFIDRNGVGLVHHLAKSNSAEIANFPKKSVFRPDNNGLNAFHYAVDGGSLEAIDHLLLKKGSELAINHPNIMGHTPIFYVSNQPDANKARSLINKLVEGGASIDVCGTKGYGLLHYAVRSNNLAAFSAFVEKGIDLNKVYDITKEGHSTKQTILEFIKKCSNREEFEKFAEARINMVPSINPDPHHEKASPLKQPPSTEKEVNM